ncbi:B3 domain-containing protein At2g31720 isoform X2 [Brassica rapa]|uniref:B3 domain-containing protein At2g31720 isoform X2 n=1 Tax=Brassica campestris TaxID=3711 RepID=UPI00142E23EF|nr:B3 domain-containing protein At2g31720 isoform X2 [Brassica rapa]
MVTHDDDDDANKRGEGSSQEGEKRCFDLFAALLHAYGDDETRARRGQEEQARNMLMIHTITSAATNAFLRGKRKIDDECKNQENTASSSYTSSSSHVVESKRRRVVESNDEPIRAKPIREIKPPVKERKRPVKQKEPVRREPGVTPGWLVELMRRKNGADAKLVIEKVITKTDLKPDQGRLLIPFKQIIEDFLNERELSIVEEHHRADRDEGLKGVDVVLLNLRIWEMRSSFNYALCSGWNQFVRDNDLEVNQTRRLWSFHSRDGTLFLAFDPLTPAQPQDIDEGMALALVPFNPEASSSSMALVVTSEEDPFVCEEGSRRLLPKIPRSSRTHRVCVSPPTSDSSDLYLDEGLDLNRTPPEECTEMDPLEAVQETHIRWTSQEAITETSLVSFTETTTVDLELRL